MSYHPDDTICAIATAPGGAARGMVRISGPEAIEVVARVSCSAGRARLTHIHLPQVIGGRASVSLHEGRPQEIPYDAFLWPTSRSYTREPVAELHTLGSPPLLDALLATLCGAGARLAAPGEFTLRAFLAGRVDLTQAEAVLGVIDAHNQDELTAALAQLAGGLGRPLQQLRDDLLQLLAELEAGLDFVDEDIEFVSREALLARLEAASRLLANVEQQMSTRGTTTARTQVALVGAPNAGKSSLFNVLVARFGLGRDGAAIPPTPAIVSPHRGTTRDYVTATIDLRGAQCQLVDTAGEGSEPLSLSLPLGKASAEGTGRERLSYIDAAAQSLAAERRAGAAIRLCCIDATGVSSDVSQATVGVADVADCDIVVLTKSDLARVSQQQPDRLNQAGTVVTSSRTGEGIDELCRLIRTLLGTKPVSEQGQALRSTAARCRESIGLAQSAVSRATQIIDQNSGNELAAAELHIALTELGKVVGAVYTDDLLDRVFSTFCIGK